MPAVVTCLLTNDEGKMLILKRSNKVKTYKGMWGGVAGYVEKGEEPYETALKEIREEVGIKEDGVSLIKRLDPIEFTDIYRGEKYDWIIHPFIFLIKKKDKIQIDWEHTQYKWILPPEITRYDTVPHLKKIISKIQV